MADEDDSLKCLGSWEMGEVLGEGAFSKVRLGKHVSTAEKVAVKIVDKEMIRDIKDLERAMREMHVLKNIQHPNIIKLHEVVEKGEKLYLVLDYAEGGELYDYILEQGTLPERECKTYFGQILSGVDFLHRQKIAHRDLKPENILMVHQGSGLVCKVADLGLSNDMVSGGMLKTICGTPAYAAPEITLGHKYDGVAADIWSLGTILFVMAIGSLPFNTENQAELYRRIQGGIFTIPVTCSPELTDLIRKFMEVSPNNRVTISQAWQHPWMSSLNNRFLDLDFEVEGELEQELGAVRLEGSGSSGSEFKFGETSIKGLPFPEQMLELLSNHHLPSSYFDNAVTDDGGISYLSATLNQNNRAPGEGEGKPASTKMTLFSVPKPSRTSSSESASRKSSGGSQGKTSTSPSRTSSSQTKPSVHRRPSSESAQPSASSQRGATDLATVLTRDPRLILRDLQRLFSDYKVAMRSVTNSSLKGEKNRVRFELSIWSLGAINDKTVEGPELFLVASSRISGDVVACRDICRRVLLKL